MSVPPLPAGYILIVEDDVDVRETLAEVLEEEGYAVVACVGGHAALAHLRAQATRPSLILLDLMMPNMDGWAFRREQQQDAALAAVPTVVLSADGNVSANLDAMQVDGYLRKPIHIAALLERVEAHCGRPSQA